MTLLVVGASGDLGGELCRQALAAGVTVAGTYHRAPGRVSGIRWHRLDARDPAAVRHLVSEVRPRVVVNAAARPDDWALCADAAGHVAVAAVAVGARLVHVSSDALHGGRPQPYGDDEPPAPVYPYGAAKAAGETAVRAVDPGAVVVRTSLILGGPESRQVRLCLDLVTGARSGALFSDEVRCPVPVSDLAAALLELAESRFAGVLNVAGPHAVSRAELGALVARAHGLDPAAVPVSTIAAAGLVRPAHVVLDSAGARRLLTTRLRGAREFLGG